MTERITKQQYITYNLGRFGPHVEIMHGRARLYGVNSTGLILSRKDFERMLRAIEQMESEGEQP